MAVVGALHLVPVKGLAALAVDRVEVGPHGIVGDRGFSIVDGEGGLHTGRRQGALLGVRPALSADGTELALAFPSGEVVRGPVALGPRREAVSYDTRYAGRRVEGPFGPALEALVGRPAELIRHDAVEGPEEEAVSLVTASSLAELAAQLGRDAVDRRRFRMGIEVDGASRARRGRLDRRARWPSAGRSWRSSPAASAASSRRVTPRRASSTCSTLRALADLRGRDDVCLGVLCRVVTPGPVAVGDPVRPSASARGASGAA